MIGSQRSERLSSRTLFFCCAQNPNAVVHPKESDLSRKTHHSAAPTLSSHLSQGTVATVFAQQDEDLFFSTEIVRYLSKTSHDLFLRFLRNKSFSKIELNDLVKYLRGFLSSHTSVHLLTRAVDFFVKTETILYLTHCSLYFFEELFDDNENAYFELMEFFKNTAKAVFLKNHHIDAVVELFREQQKLPDHIQLYVKQHLSVDVIRDVIMALRPQYLGLIREQGQREFLAHHTEKHAREMVTRLNLGVDELLWVDDKSSPFYLLIQMATEAHDFIQRNSGDYATVELATVAHLLSLLVSMLGLSDSVSDQNVVAYIQIIFKKIIVQGTTLIFGSEKVIDLTEIYDAIADAATKANMPIAKPSNLPFINILNGFAILIGVFDKSPNSVYAVNVFQASHSATNSLRQIRSFCAKQDGRLIFDDFFRSKDFYPAFKCNSIDINAQTFLLALAQHFHMSIELAAKKGEPFIADQAKSLILVLKELQDLFLKTEADGGATRDDFYRNAQDLFEKNQISAKVEQVFFSRINEEIQFSKNLSRPIGYAKDRLIKLGYLNKNGTINRLHHERGVFSYDAMMRPFISPDVPATDAENLSDLSAFYKTLYYDERQRFLLEIFANAIHQAGLFYCTQESFCGEKTIKKPPRLAFSMSHRGQQDTHQTPRSPNQISVALTSKPSVGTPVTENIRRPSVS